MPPIIPQSLQPGIGQQVKPPTVAEQKLIKKYGSVERGRAIQAQQAEVRSVIPEGFLTQSDISNQLQIAQQELNQISIERERALAGMRSGLQPGENIGSSQRKEFNRVWNIKQEQANRKVIALGKIKTLVGNKAISPESLRQYIAGSTSGAERDLRRSVSAAKQREGQRQDIETYEGVITTFGTELDPQEIIQLTPEQARVVGISQEDIASAKASTSASRDATTTKVKVPTGWWTDEVLELHQEFSRKNPDLSWEQVTSSPEYQRRVQEIASKPENRESIKRFAERRNLLGEGYGEDIEVSPITYEQSIQLSEMGKAARYRQTFLGQAFDVSESLGITQAIKDDPKVRVTKAGLSGITTGLKTYASRRHITKVGETINLPVTSTGLDIIKAAGDILNAYEYNKQSEIMGKKSIEDRSKFLSQQVTKLDSAQTNEEVQKIIRDIKNRGIKVEEITSEAGEISYKFNIPIPAALKSKLDASTLASFFTSASGLAYGETFAGLTLSGGIDSVAGRIGTAVGETAPFFAGPLGGALIAEPFIEKGLYGKKGELREYAIEHPFESLLLGAVVVGGVYAGAKKIKATKQYKSFQQAKNNLKKLQEYYNTIQPKPVGKGASYIEGYSGRLTRTRFNQLSKLNIERRILDQAVNVKFTSAYQEFSKTVPTMTKTSKGLYQVNEFGKTVKFFNNQFTVTFITKEGKAITVTLAARSNRPLRTLDAFLKYGRDKKIITGFTAGDFTTLSMGRLWGGEIRDSRTFLAKETTEKGTNGLRTLEVRETFGAEKYTDDFAELFGISPKVSETKFKTVKGAKEQLAFGEISMGPEGSGLDLFMGYKQPGGGIQFSRGQTGIGDPFFTKIMKEQSKLKGKVLTGKPQPPPSFLYDVVGFSDDVIIKPKGGPPRPDVLSSDIFGRGLMQEKKVVKTTKDIVQAQEAATRSFGITDIRTRAPPPPKPTNTFGEMIFGETKFEGLGSFDSGRFKLSTEEIEQEKLDLEASPVLIFDSDIKSRADTRQKQKLEFEPKQKILSDQEGILMDQVISPMIKMDMEIDTKSKITSVQRAALKQKQVPKQREVVIPGFGEPSIPTPTGFFFPGESPSFKIIPDLDRKKKKFQKGTRTGYHTFVKDRGRLKKVTTTPHTKSAAKDIGARMVDNTTSAMFHIEPIKQTKVIKGKKRAIIQRFEQEELKKGDGYFSSAAGKFRNFMIKRGNKVQMNNKWIEKKTKRNDTIGEQRGLTVSQFKARQTKVRLGLPTRRTKKGSNSRQRFRL